MREKITLIQALMSTHEWRRGTIKSALIVASVIILSFFFIKFSLNQQLFVHFIQYFRERILKNC